MRSLFAAVALFGCFVLPPHAHSQNGPVIKWGSMAKGISPNATGVSKTIQRYKTPGKQDWLASYTEYQLPDCTPHGSGTWIFDPKGKSGEITQDIVVGPLGNGDCPNSTFRFASIYYKWTAHNNHSAEPNDNGPTEKFNSTWKPPTLSPFDFSFSVSVPVVRPAGEFGHFTHWDMQDPFFGATAVFEMTLKCCAPAGANGSAGDGGGDNDRSFDFSGEYLEEAIVGRASNTAACDAGQPRSGKVIQVLPGNRWTPDRVGWLACLGVARARCFKSAPCTATFTQEMRIKSPADRVYTVYTLNRQGSTFEAGTIDPAPNTNKVTHGTVSAYRGNAFAPPNPVTTNLSLCPVLKDEPCQP